ncbi:anthranilate synthase component II [Risungbinella massiliensis]|uniref:anthranilate synthase component II n=1 Tax=Risungbinella massiliensis TaxID=1329796 RepID=UPI0005CBAEDA|nr:aminodeoxychorismate/anthranilate synthase component II [Risungbinella massiliensis]
MILLIDNYDSFTYNLYHQLAKFGSVVQVVRNDAITLEQIQEMNPEVIVLSPGPGRPEDAGVCVQVIRSFYQTIPILGICLGHQAIVSAFDGKIISAKTIKHGKTSMIQHSRESLFSYLPKPFEAMRYHSLVASREALPDTLQVLAISMDDGEIMAIKHQHYPVYGLQFHPESIGTKLGDKLIERFLMDVSRRETGEFVSS